MHLLRSLVAIGLVLLLMALAACASLPDMQTRRASHALAPDASTALVRAAASAQSSDRDASGLQLLADGEQALDARLALIERAERTIDVQTYLIAADEVGLRVLGALRDAAARGVRVRLLLDDLYTAGEDRLLAAVAAQPGIELRLFNPLPARGEGFSLRLLRSLHEFERINHRMHNKLLIVDQAFAIAGGRNLANEYFMRSAQANFIDVDLLLSGPALRELSAAFDAYWNSEHAWPVQQLMALPDDATAQAVLDQQLAGAGPAPRAGDVRRQLDSGRLESLFAVVHALADDPSKASGAPVETTMDHALDAMRGARRELLIVSPYFVPGEQGMAVLREAAGRAVEARVLTNSLASTDEPLVHSGYARYRPALLTLGVKLCELGSRLGVHSAGWGELRASSHGRLHAKVTVIDRERVLLGSMNMDRRSARLNTELVLQVDSPALAQALVALFDAERDASGYRLRLHDGDQRIEWLDARGTPAQDAEPDTGLAQRLRLGLVSLVVAEDLL
jgi:putative cardiolipin synthase